MTAKTYVLSPGIPARGLLVALALYCVSLSAFAVNAGNIGRASLGRNGNSASIGPGTNSGGSQIPVSPSVGGWTQAGNYGVPPSATPGGTMNLTLGGDVVFSGVKYPFQAGYVQPWSGMVGPALGALGTLGCSLVTGGLATVACLAIPIAAPHIYKWITDSGGRFNPETGQLERTDPTACTVEPCYGWQVPQPYTAGDPTVYRTKAGVMDAYKAAYNAANTFYQITSCADLGGNTMSCERTNGGGAFNVDASPAQRPPDSSTWLPSSMDDIAPYMQARNPDSRVVGEILSRGGEIPLGTPTVTGPSSIQGPERSKDNADGTREVSRTTYNFNTAGNTITNTSNVTTYNTYNSGGTLTSSRSETTMPAATDATPSASTNGEDPPTQCDKYPQTLGCAELDTPSVPIPKENKNVTFTEENPFGGGACPADAYTSLQTLGGLNVKLVDWATFCGMALPVRFLVLALASIMAFFIIMPGGVRE